jgi:RNA polymerase sigma factor (TIGR02999 family)
MNPSAQEVTQLLQAWRNGDQTALDRLIPLVYEELHHLAKRYMARQAPGHTLQTTALINEVYTRLIDQSHIEWQNRAHFFAVCATIMRNILVDQFRHQRPKVTLSEGALVSPEPDMDVMVLDEALAMSEKPMILNNRYSIERELGRVGLGVVYLAHDLKLHSRRVVVKVLQEEIGYNDYWKRKFRQEIEALARFENPHIVGILDIGELPGGESFFIMAYVEGVNLRSVMKGEGMEFARVVRLVRQIGQAPSYAHDRFVYHRDLKPGNIMLQRAEDEEFIILIDFGTATVKESQPATRSTKTAITGTPEYMAPEQTRGEPSAASDIYALGVIAYEMLTGRQPFAVPRNERGEPLLAELYKVQQAGVKVRPKDLRSDLPEAAQAAILKALSFDPKDRHPRARDFSEALARALTGEKAALLSEMPTYSGSTTVDILDEPQFAEVVISYCAQDLRQAHQLADHLKAVGVKCWMTDHGHEVNLDDRSEESGAPAWIRQRSKARQ